MTAHAGSTPDRHRDLTRPDLPLPRSSGSTGAPPASPAPPGSQPRGWQPLPVPPTPPGPARAAPTARRGRNWHRFHYPVGVFLVAYGVTGLVTGALGWDDRREELARYIGDGLATPGLVAVKAVQALLVVVTVAGLVRRRDVWFLPALAGWTAGFGVFTLLDIFKGNWSGLLEHLVFLAGLGLLLFLSYGLSVRARIGRAAVQPPPPAPAPPGPGASVPPGLGAPTPQAPAMAPAPPMAAHVPDPARGLTRTQEFALNAVNRLQERITGENRRPQAPAQAQAAAPAQAPTQGRASETETDADASQEPGQDNTMTVQTPLPRAPQPPPQPTRPLPLPDSPDQPR
jgi:hypothetical protein